MISMRMTKVEDIDKISLVLAESWKTEYRGIVHDDYLDSLKNDHWVDFLNSGLTNNSIFSMILEENQQIIGAAILSKTKKDDEIELTSLYLLPDKIGQGLGHIFYNEIETEIIKRGYLKCVLDVLENNKRAIRFYIAHNFTDTNREITAELGSQSYVCKVFEKALS